MSFAGAAGGVPAHKHLPARKARNPVCCVQPVPPPRPTGAARAHIVWLAIAASVAAVGAPCKSSGGGGPPPIGPSCGIVVVPGPDTGAIPPLPGWYHVPAAAAAAAAAFVPPCISMVKRFTRLSTSIMYWCMSVRISRTSVISWLTWPCTWLRSPFVACCAVVAAGFICSTPGGAPGAPASAVAAAIVPAAATPAVPAAPADAAPAPRPGPFVCPVRLIRESRSRCPRRKLSLKNSIWSDEDPMFVRFRKPYVLSCRMKEHNDECLKKLGSTCFEKI
mmetsp:Transcript_4742/g.12194  ORF Transcript_4742/g.12194 Transcript_4742/m.12194 type:complete len:277 (+) Transcript_4742:302-1132(+)